MALHIYVDSHVHVAHFVFDPLCSIALALVPHSQSCLYTQWF